MDAPWLPMRTADCSDTLDRPAASSLSYCTACSGSSHQASPKICLPLPPAHHDTLRHTAGCCQILPQFQPAAGL